MSSEETIGEETLGEVIRNIQSDVKHGNDVSAKTLAKATETNGRVNRLWDTVFGIDEQGIHQQGLKTKMEEIEPMMLVFKQGVTIGKWLLVTFVGAIVVGAANLIVQVGG